MTTMIHPLLVLLSPFFYAWTEISFWSQLLMFAIFGLTPPQKIVDEETQTVEENEGTTNIPDEIIM